LSISFAALALIGDSIWRIIFEDHNSAAGSLLLIVNIFILAFSFLIIAAEISLS